MGTCPLTEEVVAMAEDFNATGVRIERWLRSLTRAGQVVIRDGRLALLTSYGTEIDSAPLAAVQAHKPLFAARDRALAVLNGHRYSLTLGAPELFLKALEAARPQSP